MRAEGHSVMPLRGDPRSAPVPGAVDGWLALHHRFGRRPLEEVLAPAIELAEEGFVASLLLALSSHLVADVAGAGDLCPGGPRQIGSRVRLPGVARMLRAIATEGRDGFYRGEFGRSLLEMGDGVFTPADLDRTLADWHEPVQLRRVGTRPVDRPSPVTGLPHPGQLVDGRAVRIGGRSQRPELGPPGGRGLPGRRLRPPQGAPRAGRREWPGGRGPPLGRRVADPP